MGDRLQMHKHLCMLSTAACWNTTCVTLVDDHCKELSSDSFCGAVSVGAVSVGSFVC